MYFENAYSFAQPHLVCKDAIEAILVEGDEPSDPPQLIVPHLSIHCWQETLQTHKRAMMHCRQRNAADTQQSYDAL